MTDTPRDSGPINLKSNEFFAAGESSKPSWNPPVSPATSSPPPMVSSTQNPVLKTTGPIIIRSSNTAWILLLLVSVGAAIACGLLLKMRADMTEALRMSEAARVSAQSDALRAATDLEEKAALIKVLEEERAKLAAEKAAQEAELAKLKETQDALAERMRSELVTGDVQLSRDGSKLTVNMVDKLLFDSGQAEITPRGKEILAKLGTVFAKVDDRAIQVVGHTDDAVPTDKIKEKFPTNWELSVARATNVVRYLSEEAKVPGKRLVAVGQGQFSPVATNANPKGRAKNRRIEILLTPLVVGKATP